MLFRVPGFMTFGVFSASDNQEKKEKKRKGGKYTKPSFSFFFTLRGRKKRDQGGKKENFLNATEEGENSHAIRLQKKKESTQHISGISGSDVLQLKKEEDKTRHKTPL